MTPNLFNVLNRFQSDNHSLILTLNLGPDTLSSVQGSERVLRRVVVTRSLGTSQDDCVGVLEFLYPRNNIMKKSHPILSIYFILNIWVSFNNVLHSIFIFLISKRKEKKRIRPSNILANKDLYKNYHPFIRKECTRKLSENITFRS